MEPSFRRMVRERRRAAAAAGSAERLGRREDHPRAVAGPATRAGSPAPAPAPAAPDDPSVRGTLSLPVAERSRVGRCDSEDRTSARSIGSTRGQRVVALAAAVTMRSRAPLRARPADGCRWSFGSAA